MTVDELDPDVRRLVERLTTRLLSEGANAVVLAGSMARGTARPDSDVDLFAIGEGPSEQHEVADGRLVGIHWFTPEDVRARLSEPGEALMTARAWREAIVVRDPDGIADELRRAEGEWSWDDIGARADIWLREELVGWAEYVVKLRHALEDGRLLDARALAAETALKLGQLVAVANRLSIEFENGFWEQVTSVSGSEWRRAFEQALGGEDAKTSSQAAVELFSLAVEQLEGLLDDDERAVVDRALS